MTEVDNVYEVVAEKEYNKKVLSRLDDDWIVDDGMLPNFFLVKLIILF